MSSLVADIIEHTVQKNPKSNLGLPTGNTPIGMYQELVKRNINWSRVNSFNLDEYSNISENHPASFNRYMQEHFHSKAKLNKIFFPSEDYDDLIESHGGLDLTILGLGMNGHIAFNEPGSEIDSKTRIVKLDPRTILTNKKPFGKNIQFPTHALTMGIETILKSKKIILVVKGQEKFWVLKKSVWGEITPVIPATFLQTHPNLTVFYCD